MKKREYLENLADFCEKSARNAEMLWNGLLNVYAPCKENQRRYAESIAMCKAIVSYWRLLAVYMRCMCRKER